MSYYITVNREQRFYQLSLKDILNGVEESKFTVQRNTRDTLTWRVNSINTSLIQKTNFSAMKDALVNFVERYKNLISIEDKTGLYYSFKIPKRSGGLRQIDAPNEELKKALYDLKDVLEHKFYLSYHTSAFAYVRGRSTIDAVKRHQSNNSRWFLKMDMRHFFPSTTPYFLSKMLHSLYPFCEFIKIYPDGARLLDEALSLCFLRGGLPQGTPTSPMLTNAMMIPIDHAISKMCHEYAPHLCYTRYADDIIISSQYSFMWSDVQRKVVDILKSFEAPFELHPQKTRYGSSNGRNWNLGLMLNKDNQITIGYARKKTYKAMLYQFVSDMNAKRPWSIDDVQHLLGLTSYYRMIEKENIDHILSAYSAKFNLDIENTAKSLLRA